MNTTSLFPDEYERPAQQVQLANRTWNGQPVVEIAGTLEKLYPRVPFFSRQPFQARETSNQYLDVIVREPEALAEDAMPVATVSKSYRLIQHRDILSAVHRALALEGLSIARVQSQLLLSEYGERMQWSCDLPGFDFDPGDGYPVVLRINCLNSVDTSTVMEIRLTWCRLVCQNGMMYRFRESKLRRRHISSLNPEEIARYLDEELDHLTEEQSLYRKWYKTPVHSPELERWVDGAVAEGWGPHAAARAWSILHSGRDGEVESFTPRQPPHTISLRNTHPVPGASAPVQNLFHASQALSWLAGRRTALQEHLEYIMEIPGLMDALSPGAVK